MFKVNIKGEKKEYTVELDTVRSYNGAKKKFIKYCKHADTLKGVVRLTLLKGNECLEAYTSEV